MFVEETRSARRRFLVVGLGAITLLYLIVFVMPMLYMVAVSFGTGNVGAAPPLDDPFEAYTNFWGTEYYRNIMYMSLRLGLYTIIGTIFIGLPLAYLAAKGPSWYRIVTLVAVLNPLFVSTIIRAFGLGVVLDYIGIGDGFPAVLVGSVQILLPFMVIPLMTGFRDLDPLVIHTARTLGSGRFRIAFRIALPTLAPSLLAGSVLVFILAINIFSIPLILGRPENPTMALLVFQLALTHANFTFAAAVAMIMLVLALAVIWFQGRLVKGGGRSVIL